MAKPLYKRIRNRIFYHLIRILFFIPRIIPRKLGIGLFRMVGRLAFCIPTVETRRTIDHLRLVFGESWSEKKLLETAKNVYRNLGGNLFDALLLTRCSNERFFRIVTTDPFDSVKQACDKGKGVIFICSHLGCFEMLIHVVGRKGINCFSIGQKLFDPKIDNLVSAMRSRNNCLFLHRDGSGRELLRLLSRGYLFGVLLDQDTNINGVFARFLNHLSYTPCDPVRLAMLKDIPLFVGYTARQANNTHHFYVNGPISLYNTGVFEKDLVMNVQQVNDILGKGIMDFPDQWVWMHRRWRHTPEDEGFEKIPNIDNYL